MTKQNTYTLVYNVQIGGKSKTMTVKYTNLKEARKAGIEHLDGHVSLKNDKGVSLTL
jgi:hypothetical protein